MNDITNYVVNRYYFAVSKQTELLSWPRLENGLKSVRPSVRPSVCPVGTLTVTHQGAACDAVIVQFGPIYLYCTAWCRSVCSSDRSEWFSAGILGCPQ